MYYLLLPACLGVNILIPFPCFALYLALDNNEEQSSYNLITLFRDVKSFSIFSNSFYCLSDFCFIFFILANSNLNSFRFSFTFF